MSNKRKTEMQKDTLTPKYPAYYLIGISLARFDCSALAVPPT